MDTVQSYAFGRGDAQPPVMLSGLDRLGDKLARRMRGIVEPIAGVRPEVTAVPAELIEYIAWSEAVPANSSIGIYRAHPLKGHILLRMDAAMISGLVDRFYGGVTGRPALVRAEFTPTEERLIARLSESVMTALAASWAEIMPIEPALATRESGAGLASNPPLGDTMAVQRFTISLSRDCEWSIEILIPLASLRAVEPLMGSKVNDEPGGPDPIWQARLARQLTQITLPARTVLARPNLSLKQLMQLKPGDVIPVTISRSLPLIVNDRIVAHGHIGEQDGRAAFMIEKLH